MTLLAAGMSAEDGDTAAVAAMAATATTTATATAAPVSLADHCRGCCLEMLTLLAVIYFLKSVLNFDVFSGPGSLRSPSKPTSWTHSDGEQTQQGDEDTGLQEEDQQSKASSDGDNSDNVIAAESDDGDGDGDGDEGDNEITCDRSYEVSAWSEDPGGHTDTDSDDDDDDDDDDGDQVDTNITNLSDGSGEDLGDMSSHEFNAIDLSLEQDQEGSTEGGDDSEGEGEAESLHQSVLDTEWYRQYAEYQATTDQGER